MNIYSCVDSKNISKIYVLFYSVFKNSKNFDKLKFYILTDQYPEEKIPTFLKDKLKIGIIKFDNYWNKILNDFNKNFYQNSNWCKSDLNFARFFIFEMFEEIDRAIYLDWDMIVQKDIFELKEYYKKDDIIVAKLENQDTLLKNIIKEPKKLKMESFNLINKDFKINLMNQSFNSGFYIISKNHFELKRLSSFIRKLINYQKNFSFFRFGTQVIMNLFPFNFEFIDFKWNTSNKDSSSYIIHWSGSEKPWKSKDIIWTNYFNSLYNLKEVQENKKNNNLKINKKFLTQKLFYKI